MPRRAALALALVATAVAADPAAELEALRARIDALTDGIARDRERLGAAGERLAALDLELEAGAERLAALERSLAAHLERLRDLERERREQAATATTLRAALAEQLRAAHRLGRHDALRLLLDQDDSARAERLLVYHRYVSRARAQRIAALGERLREIEALTRAIDLETHKLRRLRAEAETELAALARRREERAALVARLEHDIAARDRELAALREDAGRLQGLIDELENAAVRPPAAGGDFGALAGRLGWPVEGRVKHRFGSPRGGDLRWQGVLLEASPGSPVSAVAPGRVVFADEFRNLGRLLIVDHGGGYMSLYGHNHRLQKAAGDAVEAGEVIATLGGGEAGAELYFEIRKDGRPLDPARWCASRTAKR